MVRLSQTVGTIVKHHLWTMVITYFLSEPTSFTSIPISSPIVGVPLHPNKGNINSTILSFLHVLNRPPYLPSRNCWNFRNSDKNDANNRVCWGPAIRQHVRIQHR